MVIINTKIQTEFNLGLFLIGIFLIILSIVNTFRLEVLDLSKILIGGVFIYLSFELNAQSRRSITNNKGEKQNAN